jgi:hypothetical protein
MYIRNNTRPCGLGYQGVQDAYAALCQPSGDLLIMLQQHHMLANTSQPKTDQKQCVHFVLMYLQQLMAQTPLFSRNVPIKERDLPFTHLPLTCSTAITLMMLM